MRRENQRGPKLLIAGRRSIDLDEDEGLMALKRRQRQRGYSALFAATEHIDPSIALSEMVDAEMDTASEAEVEQELERGDVAHMPKLDEDGYSQHSKASEDLHDAIAMIRPRMGFAAFFLSLAVNIEWEYQQLAMYTLMRHKPKVEATGHPHEVAAVKEELQFLLAELTKSTGFALFEHAMAEQWNLGDSAIIHNQKPSAKQLVAVSHYNPVIPQLRNPLGIYATPLSNFMTFSAVKALLSKRKQALYGGRTSVTHAMSMAALTDADEDKDARADAAREEEDKKARGLADMKVKATPSQLEKGREAPTGESKELTPKEEASTQQSPGMAPPAGEDTTARKADREQSSIGVGA